MVEGVGGSSADAELERLAAQVQGTAGIPLEEHRQRLSRLRRLLADGGYAAMFLHAGVNLFYFTGTRFNPSERLVGVLVPADGPLLYVVPAFEEPAFGEFMGIEGEIVAWQEHENAAARLAQRFAGAGSGPLAVDPTLPLFAYDSLRRAWPDRRLDCGSGLVNACRGRKSAREIAIMQQAKNMTLEVQRSAARMLRPGITTTEVASFIDRAHRAIGAPAGSAFCIVLFGAATAFPHGVAEPQVLGARDWVLIDTGCRLHGYHSDITRSYPFGEPTARQREAWEVERQAQAAAFEAARPGSPCEGADAAARRVLEGHGFGPDYRLPGLPHRTGHGCGLEIHEAPYLVRGDRTPLAAGMVFSNEPMLVLPGEFGVRTEDHFYMRDDGPRWFTQPPTSIEDPLNLADAG